MKKNALTRGLTLLLALTLLLVFAFGAMAATRGDGYEGNGCRKDYGFKWHRCHKPIIPVNDTGYLIIRKLATDSADVGKPFYFTYSVNGGAKVSLVLAAASTSAKATTYKMTFKVGTKFEVFELYGGDYDTTVNGVSGMSYSGTIKPGDNVVEFVNSPYVFDYEFEEEVPALG